ncbi:MAG: metallopeptidase TldD-related protein, partial [Candidatus Poribacteria bacterium]|nr:metallopeptidase TldD-related protein [Candidatus Poribacteria bacterium]
MQSEVYMGEIPLMTDQGTFIINGSERVIVSQLHRSSGVMFKEEKHSNGRQLLKAVIIPYHGAWIEFEFDIKDLIYVRLDRKKKMFATILLRALGWETDEEIIRLFTKKTETIPVNNSLAGRILVPPVIDQETGETLYESCTKLTETDFEVLQQAGIQSIEVLTAEEAEAIRFLRNTIEKDRQSTSYTKGNITDKALVEISRKIQPGDPPTPEDAKSQLQKLFFDTNSYDLTRGGRNKLNQKFNHLAIYYGKPQRPKEKTTELPADRILRKEDIVSTIQYLLDIYDVRDRAAQLDDPHHLGNRRVRTVGKLLMDQVQIGLLRVTRSIRNKMTAKQGRDWEVEGITPFDLINPKPLSSVLRDFFGSDELSIVDDGTLAGEAGYNKYDSEGTPTQKTYLIKDGILTNRLHSRET